MAIYIDTDRGDFLNDGIAPRQRKYMFLDESLYLWVYKR